MFGFGKWMLLSGVISLVALQSVVQSDDYVVRAADSASSSSNAQDRSFLDWVGLGTGPDVDPFLAKTNAACLDGDLAECFKSRALVSLDDFFDKAAYQVTEHVRIRRMPEVQLRQLAQEPFEYSEAPRTDEPEWDQLVKFVMRKLEKFLKSRMIEFTFDDEVTERGRYSPRFIDEITEEIDIIEDKKDSLFKRKQLKKLFVPMLIILKLFKLKLLLFLPLILGLASFKKFLGFLAIIIPGIIAYFKFCKATDLHSNLHLGGTNHHVPHYSQSGVAYPSHYKDHHTYAQDYHGNFHGGNYHDKGVNFDEAQNLAYGWYRNNMKNIDAEVESSSKKSILPDS